jgi:hypothetical protein
MAENVILLQRPGRHSFDRQVRACTPYLDENHYVLVGTAVSHIDAFQLVYSGVAKVVVAVNPADDDWRLERLLDEAGGRLEICRTGRRRPPVGSPLGHDTEEIVTRMAGRGGTTGEIVRLLGVAEERVRQILRRDRRSR